MSPEYRDSFAETGWTRFLRALSASFRLGHFFGVEVRVFWLAIVITPLIVMRGASGLPFLQGLLYVGMLTLSIFLIIWTHEMGHILAGRRLYGIHTPLITLSPLGGLAHMSAAPPHPRAEALVALAGPAVHLLWLVPAGILSLVLDYGDTVPGGWLWDPLYVWVDFLLLINLWLMAFNLLPFFPLDGGRVFRALLARKVHPNRATVIAARVGMAGGIVFLAVGIGMWIFRNDLWGPILAMIGVSNITACKREIAVAAYTAGPYMESIPRAPWEMDPDAWKRAAGGGEPSKPGAVARWKSKRAQKRREREAADEEAFEQELDRVLGRVSDVGLDGLTAKERAILKKASERRQGR